MLIDVARFKGVDQLPPTYEITPADLAGALQRQRVEIGSGDVVLVHTGWGSLWMKENAKFVATSPGIGVAAAELLVKAEVVLVGSDNWGVEVMPNPNADLSAPVHQLFLARNGIYLHENLATEALARDNVYEFAYVFALLRLKGATGSPGNPIALRHQPGFRHGLLGHPRARADKAARWVEDLPEGLVRSSCVEDALVACVTVFEGTGNDICQQLTRLR